MVDLTHLNELQRLQRAEQDRLSRAANDSEKSIRTVWVDQLQKEVDSEMRFLGIEPLPAEKILSDDEVMSELEGF
jgi:hypothetical protein